MLRASRVTGTVPLYDIGTSKALSGEMEMSMDTRSHQLYPSVESEVWRVSMATCGSLTVERALVSILFSRLSRYLCRLHSTSAPLH